MTPLSTRRLSARPHQRCRKLGGCSLPCIRCLSKDDGCLPLRTSTLSKVRLLLTPTNRLSVEGALSPAPTNRLSVEGALSPAPTHRPCVKGVAGVEARDRQAAWMLPTSLQGRIHSASRDSAPAAPARSTTEPTAPALAAPARAPPAPSPAIAATARNLNPTANPRHRNTPVKPC